MNIPASICDFALPGVTKLVPYQPGKPIDELERELGLSQIVKLASNENPLGLSPDVEKAIKQNLAELARYPDGNGFRLKQALADKHQVLMEQITLGNGSNEILELVARTFLSEESEVIFSQHAFAVYPLVTQAVGAKAVITTARDFGHDLDAMLMQVNENTRLIFIANPNNPTGTYLGADRLISFINQLPATVLCVLDEAYFEYIGSDLKHNSISWLQRFPNLLISRTFSKAYGLAGLRVGYSISSLEVADLLNRVRQPFNNNSLALLAAETVLADEAYLEQSISVNQSGMQQLEAGFNALGLSWIPSYGNFITVDLNQEGVPVYQALLAKGVIVRPVANYEMPNHLRISIGKEEENQIFLDALGQVL